MNLYTFIPADEGEAKALQIASVSLEGAVSLLFAPGQFIKSEWSVFSIKMEEV
tara:strand:+ start:1146 stop:1304 length:159 start_codon:yes stop_codon:yes gene_type:complete